MRFYNPENFKQGQLLINRYYPKELAILIGSIITSVVLTVVIGVFAMSIGNKLLLALMFIFALIPVEFSFGKSYRYYVWKNLKVYIPHGTICMPVRQ